MSLITRLKEYFEKNEDKLEAPEGYCPNCWGRQEYEGQFLTAIHKEKIDLNNVMEKKGWIQAYATEHLEGIKLKKSEGSNVCSTCKLTFKPA